MVAAGGSSLLRMRCTSVELRVVDVTGRAGGPWEYTGTPSREVMMLAGELRACLLWRVSWPALVLRFGGVKEETEARWMSDRSSPITEAQSRAGVLLVLFPPWKVCWVGCTTFWGGDEDGEEETLRRCVLGPLRVETISPAGVLDFLLPILCLVTVGVLEEGDRAKLCAAKGRQK